MACHYFDRPHTIDTSVTDATSSAGVTVSMFTYAHVRASIINSVMVLFSVYLVMVRAVIRRPSW